MKLSGSHHYPYPPDQVFAALLDPEVLSRTLPGCEDLQQTGDNQYAGKLKMKVGPVQGVFQGKVEIHDLDPPTSYRLKLEGSGAPGFMNGDGAIRLEPKDEGTDLHYEIDAKVGGKIASIGQRLVESSAKVITRQGLQGLGVQLERIAGPVAASTDEASDDATGGSETDESPAAEASTTELAEAPSQGEFAAEFARGMVEELAPKGSRWPLVLGALFVLATLVAIYLRACA